MIQKKAWEQPLIRSVDNLGTVLGGSCNAGTTVSDADPNQCNGGNGASGGNCSGGNGAQVTCGSGSGR